MECPNCRLFNPPNAMRCDCGYDFHDRKMQQSYLKERYRSRFPKISPVAIFFLLLFVVPWAIRRVWLALHYYTGP